MSFSTNIEDAAAKSDLVIEAIVEKLNIKQDLFSKIDKVYKNRLFNLRS